ncbi:MAG: F-box protein [Parachlamydiales bacterium]|nr:F-box protein [Parachlamydiales bacterium]
MNIINIDPFSELPTEISLKIASNLTYPEISLLRRVCKLWSSILADKALWADFPRQHGWMMKDDPLSYVNFFEALKKNQHILRQIQQIRLDKQSGLNILE